MSDPRLKQDTAKLRTIQTRKVSRGEDAAVVKDEIWLVSSLLLDRFGFFFQETCHLGKEYTRCRHGEGMIELRLDYNRVYSSGQGTH